MKARVLGIALAISMVALLPMAAYALTFGINYPNTALSDPSKSPSPFGIVTINLTDSTHANINFTVEMGPPQNDLYSIIQSPCFGVNVNATGFTVSGLTFGPGTTPGAVVYAGATGNVSDFGDFNAGFNGPTFSGDKPSTDIDYLSFSLHNTSGTWASDAAVLTPNNKNFVAFVHDAIDEGVNKGLTGFAGAHTVYDAVPVPAAAYLLGSGLLGLAGLGWRRGRKEG